MKNWGSSFSQKVSTSIDSMRLFATEKISSPDAECITELPQEYIALEQKLDKVKGMYESLLKLSSNFSLPDYDPGVSENLKAAVLKFNHLVKGGAEQPHQSTADIKPKTFAHAFARAAGSLALEIGEHEPLGAALKKFSSAQERIGDSKVKLESEIADRFTRPWSSTLQTNISFAMKARKQVSHQQSLLTDAKVRYKAASSTNNNDALVKAQNEMQQLEEEFLISVKDATHKIHLVVDSAEPLRNLSELVKAQMEYFKECFDSLNEISPDIDEMQVTQEALFRSG